MTIPNSTLVPGFAAQQDPQSTPGRGQQLALLIGQRTSSGSVSAGKRVDVGSPTDAANKFGSGSIMHLMARAYRDQDRVGPLQAIAVDDAGSTTKATATIKVSSAPTADGTIYLYIGGQRLTVGVTGGQSASTVATAIKDAINAKSDLPCTATVATATVTATAKNGGTMANAIDLRVNYLGAINGETLPAGLALNFNGSGNSDPKTFGSNSATPGSGDPDLSTTAVRSEMGSQEFDFVALGLNDSTNLDEMKAEMDERWAFDSLLYGKVWTADADTVSNLKSRYGSASRNNPHEVVVGYQVGTGQSFLAPEFEMGAAYMGAAAPLVKNDPARPLRGVELAGIRVPESGVGFSFADRDELLNNGVATVIAQAGATRIEKAVTTYQQDSQGNPDFAWRAVQTAYTLMRFLREEERVIESKFSNFKLVDNGTRVAEGANAITPNDVESEIIALYDDFIDRALMEDLESFKQSLQASRDPNNPNRLNVDQAPNVANQLGVAAVTNRFVV